MQGYLNRSNGQILGLQVFQDSPKFKIILPNSFKNNSIHYMVTVMDQGGSVTNLFGQTQVVKKIDCQSQLILSQAQKSLSLEIAYLVQFLGQEGKQCQYLGQELFLDLLSKTNLQIEDQNFWLKALKIYKTYSQPSQTRILEGKGIQNFTCYNKEKNTFQINYNNSVEQKQTKSYEQLEIDYLKYKQLAQILTMQFINLSQQLRNLTQDWNQILFQQYEETIASLQLLMTLVDDIFIDASLMNKNETRMFTFFEELINQVEQITQLLSDKAQINGKPLKVEEKAFLWKLQRLTRQKLNEIFRKETQLEDSFIQFSEIEQFEFNLNRFLFNQNISYSLKSLLNFTNYIIDQKQVIKLKLSNFNLEGKKFSQKQIETPFSIDMYKTKFCDYQNEFQQFNASEQLNASCLQFSEEKQITKCNINLINQQSQESQESSNYLGLNCICQTFGEIFILYYQDQSQNVLKVDMLTTENIQNRNINFNYKSEFVIGLIFYVAAVIIIFFVFILKRTKTQFERQITQESEDFDKQKQKQIIFYPGNLVIIKDNIKYLHSLSSFCYKTTSKITDSFHFIDLNNQLCSMILFAFVLDFYFQQLHFLIEIIIICIIGIIYRAFSKILQGFVRINRFFEIIVYIIEVILFLIICTIISLFISYSNVQNSIEQLKIIAITAIIQFIIYEILLVILSVFTYKIVYKSIKIKEFNVFYHFLYFFAYHERLEIIFDLYSIS